MDEPLAAHAASAPGGAGAPAARLYAQHATAILAYLRLRVATREEAEDLLLDVFLAALEQSATLANRSSDAQRAWLRGVAAHKVADHYRYSDARRRAPLECDALDLLADDERSPEGMALRGEEAERLRALLERLPPLQRQIIGLRFAYGLRSREIAEALGKKEGAVRKLLWRALSRIRALYQDDHQDDHQDDRS